MPTKGFLDNVKVSSKDGSALVSALNGYELSDYDASGNPLYVGLVRADGYWCINSINTTTGASRYCVGTSDYSTAWTNRASQTYALFDTVF